MMENAIHVSHMEWVLEYYGSKCEGDVVKVGNFFFIPSIFLLKYVLRRKCIYARNQTFVIAAVRVVFP
jgi:hypothetical protein